MLFFVFCLIVRAMLVDNTMYIFWGQKPVAMFCLTHVMLSQFCPVLSTFDDILFHSYLGKVLSSQSTKPWICSRYWGPTFYSSKRNGKLCSHFVLLNKSKYDVPTLMFINYAMITEWHLTGKFGIPEPKCMSEDLW